MNHAWKALGLHWNNLQKKLQICKNSNINSQIKFLGKKCAKTKKARTDKLYIFEKHLAQKIQTCKNMLKTVTPPPSVRIGLSAKIVANINNKFWL